MQRLMFTFARCQELRYISHLEIMRLLQRAMRRAGLPVVCTQGFNPQPRLSIAAPLPVGVEAENEPAEIYLESPHLPEAFVQKMNIQLPRGFSINGAVEISLESPPLMQVVEAALYVAFPHPALFSIPVESLQREVEEIRSSEELTFFREGKKGKKQINIRPYIYELKINLLNEGKAVLRMFLKTGPQGGARPREVLQVLGEYGNFANQVYLFQLKRKGLFRYAPQRKWEMIGI